MICVQEAELQGPLKGRKPPQPLSNSREGFGSRHSSASAPAPWHPLQMLGPGSYSRSHSPGARWVQHRNRFLFCCQCCLCGLKKHGCELALLLCTPTYVLLHSRIMLQNNDQALLGRSEIPPGFFCHLEEAVDLPSPCVSHFAL